jgi:hypothetical protein
MFNRRDFIKTFSLLPAAMSAAQTFAGLRQEIRPDKDGVYVINQPEHTAAEIEAAIAEIPPIQFVPPTDRWLHLPRTVAALKEKSQLNIVMLGDSIVNDTYRSQWYGLLQKAYPQCKINATAVVRGNTGCWWYREKGRIKHYLDPLQPDLLIIGGISQKNDIDSIRATIRQVRRLGNCDILLMTEVFGKTDPNDNQQWNFDIPTDPGNYRRRLHNLSVDTDAAFVDLNAYWGRYIRRSGKPVDWFKRDEVHANIKGEQVIGHLLAGYFLPSTREHY